MRQLHPIVEVMSSAQKLTELSLVASHKCLKPNGVRRIFSIEKSWEDKI